MGDRRGRALLSAGQVEALVRLIDDPAAWRPTAPAPTDLMPRFEALRRRVLHARLIRSAWRLLAGAVVVVLAALVLPGVLRTVLPAVLQALLPH